MFTGTTDFCQKDLLEEREVDAGEYHSKILYPLVVQTPVKYPVQLENNGVGRKGWSDSTVKLGAG